MLSVAKDQNGCRFLQRKFDEGGAASIAMVFPEVLDNLIELMVDPFGNYLIQKLLDRCSEEQRLQVDSRPPLHHLALEALSCTISLVMLISHFAAALWIQLLISQTLLPAFDLLGS